MEIFQINDVTNEEIRNSKSELLKQHSATVNRSLHLIFFWKETVIFHSTVTSMNAKMSFFHLQS